MALGETTASGPTVRFWATTAKPQSSFPSGEVPTRAHSPMTLFYAMMEYSTTAPALTTVPGIRME